jgi:hypothetical protein
MSRIYFHSEHGTAELSGSERAHMGTFCSSLLVASLRLDRAWSSEAGFYRRLLPPDHYSQTGDDASFLRSLTTWLSVGDGEFGVNTKVSPFDAALNTAVAIGGDAVKLMARLHGQCEVHAYVEGANRGWLADIIEHGREDHILRSGQGWEKVVELLRSRSDCPVVTSYSVCMPFPNIAFAGCRHCGFLEKRHVKNERVGGGDPWLICPEQATNVMPDMTRYTEQDEETWYELPAAERWASAARNLRASGGGLEMKPDDWYNFYFGEGVTGFEVLEELVSIPAVGQVVQNGQG